MVNKPEEPNYAKVFKYHLLAVTGMVEALFESFFGLIVGTVSVATTKLIVDGMQILFRLVPLLAPIPNTISVFRITTNFLGFSFWQAFGASSVIELTLFFLIEVTILIWGKYLYNQLKYKIPLYVMGVTTVVVSVLMVLLLWILEAQSNGHPIIAIFPAFSLASFVGIGIRSWNERDDAATKEEKEAKKQERLSRKLGVAPVQSVATSVAATESATETATKPDEQLQRRRRVATYLKVNGTATLQVVADNLGIPNKSTVSRDVAWLQQQEILVATKIGNKTNYTVNGKYEAFMAGQEV